MLRYAIEMNQLNEFMSLLYRVLDLRITLFDLQESELDAFDIKAISDFCRQSRGDSEWEKRCQISDQEHLAIAQKTRKIQIYHCHAGLLEGIVPLYNHDGIYLGAIMFGQVRDGNMTYPKEMTSLSESSEQKMRDIGELLKYLGEYICENELIRYCNKPWAERVEEYLDQHPAENITLARLAKVIKKSPSFLSHAFPGEFGMPLKQYIRKKKMEQAGSLLKQGLLVRECAFELGFFDEFHFSKEFKRFWGYPPKSLKRG